MLSNVRRKCVPVLLVVVLVFSLISLLIPSQVRAYAMDSIDSRLLVIIADESSLPQLTAEQENKIVFKHISDITEGDDNHLAYAVAKEIAEEENIAKILQTTYNTIESRIYSYGDLTIQEFKNILDIDTYSIETDIYNSQGVTEEKARMSFSKEQESNKIEQIISLSKNSRYQSLIASAPNASYEQLEEIIIDHYTETFVDPYQRSILVKNEFNYRTYPYSGDIQLTTCYLNVDYYLYKSDDENIADYDYFAIKVNVNPIYDNSSASFGKLSCDNLKVKLTLPYSNDHFYEYGPHSANKATNINVSLGFSSTGVSGGLSFTFSPGSKPTVDASFNSTTREILWNVKKYWFFGKELNNELYSFGASWASSGKLAAVDIASFVSFADFDSHWDTIQVRYSY